jgi:Ca2+-binding EF-hand superfamily protein
MEYFDKHKILQTFEYLGSQLASERPTDPNAFLVQEISKILAARSRDQKVSSFNEKDVNSLFAVFDLTNRGYLTKDQYLQALQYVGVTEPKFAASSAQMDKTTFVKAVLAELQPLSI